MRREDQPILFHCFSSLCIAVALFFLVDHDSFGYLSVRHQIGVVYGVATRPHGNWWSHIGGNDSRIILGPLPIEELGDRHTLKSLGVTRVVSLLEDFERALGWFFTPITDYNPGDDLALIAVDHEPLEPAEKLYRWVQELKRPGVVYVHCRAGKGRSASLVVAYLMTTQKKSFEAAYADVQQWRPQVRLNAEQRRALLHYGDWLTLWRRLKSLQKNTTQ